MKSKKNKHNEKHDVSKVNASKVPESEIPGLHIVRNEPDDINAHLMHQLEDIKVVPFKSRNSVADNITCLSYPLFDEKEQSEVRQNIPPEVADEIDSSIGDGNEALSLFKDTPMIWFKEIPEIFLNEFGRVLFFGLDEIENIFEDEDDGEDEEDRAGLGNIVPIKEQSDEDTEIEPETRVFFDPHEKVSIAIATIQEHWPFLFDIMHDVDKEMTEEDPFDVLRNSFTEWTPENWARARGNSLCGTLIEFLRDLPSRHTLRKRNLLEFVSEWVESFVMSKRQRQESNLLSVEAVARAFDVLDRTSALVQAVEVPKVLETAFTETGETLGTLAGWLDEKLSEFDPLWKTFRSDTSAEFGGFLSGSYTYRVESNDDDNENEANETENLLKRIKSDRDIFLTVRKFVSNPSRDLFDAHIKNLTPIVVSDSLFGESSPWSYLADSAMVSIFVGFLMEALLRWLNRSVELNLIDPQEWDMNNMTIETLSEDITTIFNRIREHDEYSED